MPDQPPARCLGNPVWGTPISGSTSACHSGPYRRPCMWRSYIATPRLPVDCCEITGHKKTRRTSLCTKPPSIEARCVPSRWRFTGFHVATFGGIFTLITYTKSPVGTAVALGSGLPLLFCFSLSATMLVFRFESRRSTRRFDGHSCFADSQAACFGLVVIIAVVHKRPLILDGRFMGSL